MREIDKILQQFFNSSIGFRDIQFSPPNYPPYNISTDDEKTYLLEVAVAGYPKDSIKIEEKNNVLKIIGTKQQVEDRKYLTKGISSKEFVLAIPIGKSINIDTAEYVDGMLNIHLSRKEEDVKLITIN